MRLIDADKFQEFIRENCAASLVELWCELVRRQPTIEAVPVVHGEWKTDKFGLDRSVCSICGAVYEGNGGNFCAKCGAKMKGGIG